MGKGNWERRAERSALEREAARERKALKNKIKCPTIEKIIHQLLEGEKYDTFTSNINVWVEDLTSERNLCCQWFRTGDCSTKRCHFSHEMTLFGIRNVFIPPPNDEKALPHEPSLDLISLHTLLPEKYALVRFITIDDFCVYDWAMPNIWLDWSRARVQEMNLRKNLKSIHEEPPHSHDELSVCEVIDSDLTLQDISSMNLTTPHSCSFDLTLLSSSLLSLIFQYCPLAEICSLSICSKQLHHLIRKDSSLRSRRKEYLQSITPLLIKQKKEEKKKKIKSSHVKKQDKKDAFARGGHG
jgi:hypothetical protein